MKDSKTLLSLTPVIERLEKEVSDLKKELARYILLNDRCKRELKEEKAKNKIIKKKFSPKTSYHKIQAKLIKNRGVVPTKLTYEDHYPSSTEYTTPEIIKKSKKKKR